MSTPTEYALKNFTLLAKIEVLALESHKVVARFPKSERHVLAADIRQTNAELLQLVIRAAKKQLEERKTNLPPLDTKILLTDTDVKLEYLKALVRMAFALRYINEKNFEDWSRQIAEIGKMLGGWMLRTDEDIRKRQPRRPERQGSLL